jgi:hypothetical protein
MIVQASVGVNSELEAVSELLFIFLRKKPVIGFKSCIVPGGQKEFRLESVATTRYSSE